MFDRANSFLRRKSSISPKPVIVGVSKMSTFSYPYTPREPSVTSIRSSSMSSNYSSTSSTRRSSRQLSNDELQDRAINILNSLSRPDITTEDSILSSYVSDSVVIQHNDDDPTTSLDSFVSRWSCAREKYPDFNIEVQEACVDETQRKVWIRSHITGVPRLSDAGLVKESVDMMTFDEDGMLVRSSDCQRVKRLHG